ncbi:hypothetical protein RA27_22110 [Ruegeria sp. ANG-R]|nr:hypothetical protein RA27_22110 [Ruegeria sp. ANG-R]
MQHIDQKLTCVLCGADHGFGSRICRVCGAEYRRPKLNVLVIHIGLVLVLLAVVELIGVMMAVAISRYSEAVGEVFEFCILILLPMAAFWALLRHHMRREWYR